MIDAMSTRVGKASLMRRMRGSHQSSGLSEISSQLHDEWSTAPGCFRIVADVSALNLPIDYNARRLVPIVFADKYDGTVFFSGVVVGYRLQVSPPPVTAHFNDVPTNHPFFQFVEALFASGITGGCGGGNYCPNTPVTRGQMAVFRAQARGLSFQ